MRGEDEIDAAVTHRFHQRQHIAAGNPEAVGDPVGFQRLDDEVGVVHGVLKVDALVDFIH